MYLAICSISTGGQPCIVEIVALVATLELIFDERPPLNFSPASRYAVSKLCDYAEQEHEQREKAETMLCGERRKALAFSAEMARQERTIADLRQQLCFMQQAMQDAGV